MTSWSFGAWRWPCYIDTQHRNKNSGAGPSIRQRARNAATGTRRLSNWERLRWTTQSSTSSECFIFFHVDPEPTIRTTAGTYVEQKGFLELVISSFCLSTWSKEGSSGQGLVSGALCYQPALGALAALVGEGAGEGGGAVQGGLLCPI